MNHETRDAINEFGAFLIERDIIEAWDWRENDVVFIIDQLGPAKSVERTVTVAGDDLAGMDIELQLRSVCDRLSPFVSLQELRDALDSLRLDVKNALMPLPAQPVGLDLGKMSASEAREHLEAFKRAHPYMFPGVATGAPAPSPLGMGTVDEVQRNLNRTLYPDQFEDRSEEPSAADMTIEGNYLLKNLVIDDAGQVKCFHAVDDVTNATISMGSDEHHRLFPVFIMPPYGTKLVSTRVEFKLSLVPVVELEKGKFVKTEEVSVQIPDLPKDA